jgi:hypothetical protein
VYQTTCPYIPECSVIHSQRSYAFKSNTWPTVQLLILEFLTAVLWRFQSCRTCRRVYWDMWSEVSDELGASVFKVVQALSNCHNAATYIKACLNLCPRKMQITLCLTMHCYFETNQFCNNRFLSARSGYWKLVRLLRRYCWWKCTLRDKYFHYLYKRNFRWDLPSRTHFIGSCWISLMRYSSAYYSRLFLWCWVPLFTGLSARFLISALSPGKKPAVREKNVIWTISSARSSLMQRGDWPKVLYEFMTWQ